MNRFLSLSVLTLSLVLLGAGCFGNNADSQPDGGVFLTRDGGQSWLQSVAVPTPEGVGTLATSSVVNLVSDPTDPSVLYIGTRENGLLYSLDAGASWQQPREAGLQKGSINAIAVDPKNICTVYIAKANRLAKSDTCLRTIDSEAYVEARGEVQVLEVAVDWFNPKIVWIGLSNGDVMRSRDGGSTWNKSLGADSAVTSLLVNGGDSRQVLVGTARDGFYRTTDSGASWETDETVLRTFRGSGETSRLIQTANGSVVIASTRYGLLRSTDFGSTWEGITLLTDPGQTKIQAIGISPTNPSIMYYATAGTFYRTLDAGSTWTTERLPTARNPEMMVVDPRDVNVVYVGVATAEK